MAKLYTVTIYDEYKRVSEPVKFKNRDEAVEYIHKLANDYVNQLKDYDEIDKYEAEDIMWYIRHKCIDVFNVTDDYEIILNEIKIED